MQFTQLLFRILVTQLLYQVFTTRLMLEKLTHFCGSRLPGSLLG